LTRSRFCFIIKITGEIQILPVFTTIVFAKMVSMRQGELNDAANKELWIVNQTLIAIVKFAVGVALYVAVEANADHAEDDAAKLKAMRESLLTVAAQVADTAKVGNRVADQMVEGTLQEAASQVAKDYIASEDSAVDASLEEEAYEHMEATISMLKTWAVERAKVAPSAADSAIVEAWSKANEMCKNISWQIVARYEEQVTDICRAVAEARMMFIGAM
jgi:hypothetical protein